MRVNSLIKKRIRKIVSCFASELTALDTAHKLKLHRNTVNKYYKLIREAIVTHQESQFNTTAFSDYVEEHYIGWHRNKGLCLHYEEGAIPFYVIAGEDKVYIQEADLQEVLEKLNIEGTDAQPGASTSKASEINAAMELDDEFEDETVAKTIRNFVAFSKIKLTKFYGIKPQYTYLYLKELEFRFNNQNKNLAKIIWNMFFQPKAKRRKRSLEAKK